MGVPSYEHLLDEAGLLGLKVTERELEKDTCGLYIDFLHTIVIDEAMHAEQKKCTLCHEIIHARHRDYGCRTSGRRSEIRARRETALRLIDPVEYASAERVYGNDVFLIACDLGVTAQVVDDYRLWLRDNAWTINRRKSYEIA
jgi:Zn-dependent peptidase ImmA (M78 family)